MLVAVKISKLPEKKKAGKEISSALEIYFASAQTRYNTIITSYMKQARTVKAFCFKQSLPTSQNENKKFIQLKFKCDIRIFRH